MMVGFIIVGAIGGVIVTTWAYHTGRKGGFAEGYKIGRAEGRKYDK